MEAHILLFCITVFLFFARSFLRKSHSKKLPPGPTGLPILGNLLQLGTRPHESLSEMAKRYGPLMTVRLGSVTTIIASSPETAKEILQNHDDAFASRPIPDSVASQPNPEGTLAWVPADHRWRNRRRICNNHLFTTQSLDLLRHFRHRKVLQLLAHIKRHCDAGTPVEIGSLAFGTTLNLMSNMIFSVDVVDPDFMTAQEFKELVWRIMEDAGKPNLSDYFPILKRFDLQGVRRHVRVSYLKLHEIFDEIIGKRLKARASDKITRHGDFLDVLLDECQLDGSDFSVETIKPLILDLFIAGGDAFGSATEWAMAELLRSPEALKKARRELLEVIGPQGEVKDSDIDRLPYIQAILKETLRLHLPAPFLLPYVAGDDVEVGGYTINKGSRVLINAWSLSRDPKYWDDPLSFKPERFLGSNLDYKGRDFAYIPFGAGRRICPGLPLAHRMVNLILASILYSFDWKLPEGITPENLDMTKQCGITLRKAIPLSIIPLIE
ncbi:Geraniol 8-hydroxylase [Morella rubra]|uniref:Geraniol 8-hydroxylase n=1 Tax=Morella rubra TaxID=262757 RepID=A0A6A1UHF0_9ROSI|nr:Geraniol 8-hydroxylase [Morella rubra]KAB1199676.1 Geraniol 8-hydroxylase [Morella rubra]